MIDSTPEEILARRAWGRLMGGIEELGDPRTPAPSLPAIRAAIREQGADEDEVMEAAIQARLVIQRNQNGRGATALFVKILREGVFDDDPDPEYARR